MSNKNEPAFPATHLDTDGKGLTKREFMAGLALQGFIASLGQHDVTEPDQIASDAVLLADALLAELEKTGETK